MLHMGVGSATLLLRTEHRIMLPDVCISKEVPASSGVPDFRRAVVASVRPFPQFVSDTQPLHFGYAQTVDLWNEKAFRRLTERAGQSLA